MKLLPDRSAEISDDGLYRYSLSRRVGSGERHVLIVGLNPSTADATTDDPTIRRCMTFARAWGFDWLLMGNLYAYRSTDPKILFDVDDPIGPDNITTLKRMVREAELVVAAWGSRQLSCSAHVIAGWIQSLPHVRCLGRNKDGSPKHPLYLAKSTSLCPYQ